MSKERVITIPGQVDHSGILLASALSREGFDIRVSDRFQIVGSKEAQSVFFDLSYTPEMALIFWAIHGSDTQFSPPSAFENNSSFSPQIKSKLKNLASKRKPNNPDKKPLTEKELADLQDLVDKFVKQQLKK